MDSAGGEGDSLKRTAPTAPLHHGGGACFEFISQTQCDTETLAQISYVTCANALASILRSITPSYCHPVYSPVYISTCHFKDTVIYRFTLTLDQIEKGCLSCQKPDVSFSGVGEDRN